MKTVYKKLLFLSLALCALQGHKAQADEKDLYDFLWLDPDKKVYVLQKKVFKKHGRSYFSAGYMHNLNSEFQDTRGAQLKGGYYFREEWAFELFYNKYNNSDNDTLNSLKRINGVVPFLRKPEKSYGGLLVWSPFYGKINTFNKIFYFDWNLGAGLARIGTESNAETAANPALDYFTEESHTGFAVKTGIKFHVKENVYIKLDWFGTYYKAQGPDASKPKNWNSHSDLIIGIGLSF